MSVDSPVRESISRLSFEVRLHRPAHGIETGISSAWSSYATVCSRAVAATGTKGGAEGQGRLCGLGLRPGWVSCPASQPALVLVVAPTSLRIRISKDRPGRTALKST